MKDRGNIPAPADKQFLRERDGGFLPPIPLKFSGSGRGGVGVFFASGRGGDTRLPPFSPVSPFPPCSPGIPLSPARLARLFRRGCLALLFLLARAAQCIFGQKKGTLRLVRKFSEKGLTSKAQSAIIFRVHPNNQIAASPSGKATDSDSVIT